MNRRCSCKKKGRLNGYGNVNWKHLNGCNELEKFSMRFFQPGHVSLAFLFAHPINQMLVWSSSLAAAVKPPEMFIPACDLSLDKGSRAVCRRAPAPPLIGKNLTLAHLSSMSTVTSSCPYPWAPAYYSACANHVRQTAGPFGVHWCIAVA